MLIFFLPNVISWWWELSWKGSLLLGLELFRIMHILLVFASCTLWGGSVVDQTRKCWNLTHIWVRWPSNNTFYCYFICLSWKLSELFSQGFLWFFFSLVEFGSFLKRRRFSQFSGTVSLDDLMCKCQSKFLLPPKSSDSMGSAGIVPPHSSVPCLASQLEFLWKKWGLAGC